MINGAHVIIYSKQAEADRAFLRDVLKFPHVDVGDGWLIFGLPPSEVAVHPSKSNDMHELYLMCDDIAGFIAEMTAKRIACTAAENLGWGIRTQLTLPGGGKLGVYQPRHARPKAASTRKPTRKPVVRAVKSAKAGAKKIVPKKIGAKKRASNK